MQFHGSFALSKLGPGEKRKTQIDGGGVEGIGGLVQFDSEGIAGIKTSSPANQDMGKVGIDSPIPHLVGMG